MSYYENVEGGPENGDIFVDGLNRHVVIADDQYHYLANKTSSGYTGISGGQLLTGTYPDHSVESVYVSQLPRTLLIRGGSVLPELTNVDLTADSIKGAAL